MPSEKWPRLSETLTGQQHPHVCQSCRQRSIDGEALAYWQECNDRDVREYRIIALCVACSDRLIEPHPRLYHRLDKHQPMPGVMAICLDCRHRDGVRCQSPQAQFNGGPGLNVIFPKPSSVHLCRSPRSKSGWVHYYPGPPTACDGREIMTE